VILTGDCLALLPTIPDETVDFVLFSPPYDAVRDYHHASPVDVVALGRALWRVTKPGGMAAVVIGDGTKEFAKSLSTFRWAVNWCDQAGWRLFECCIYQRHGRPGAWWSKRFRVDHEYILLFLKGERPAYFDKTHLAVPVLNPNAVWHGTQRHTDGTLTPIGPKKVQPTKCRGTIWSYATSNSEGNKVKMRHPATFPDRLASDLIRCFCPPDGLVLDPMCGSGTSCLMAWQTGRRATGMEISAEYTEIARQQRDALLVDDAA
jgi:site-specific DNA-methyltransferase (adenine-specific)